MRRPCSFGKAPHIPKEGIGGPPAEPRKGQSGGIRASPERTRKSGESMGTGQEASWQAAEDLAFATDSYQGATSQAAEKVVIRLVRIRA